MCNTAANIDTSEANMGELEGEQWTSSEVGAEEMLSGHGRYCRILWNLNSKYFTLVWQSEILDIRLSNIIQMFVCCVAWQGPRYCLIIVEHVNFWFPRGDICYLIQWSHWVLVWWLHQLPAFQPSWRRFVKYFQPQTFNVCGGGEVTNRTNFLLDNISIDFLSLILHPAPTSTVGWSPGIWWREVKG